MTLIIFVLSPIDFSFSWITPLARIIPKIYKLISRSFIIHFVLFLHIADTTACRIVEFLGIGINNVTVLLCCLVCSASGYIFFCRIIWRKNISVYSAVTAVCIVDIYSRLYVIAEDVEADSLS